MIEYTFWGFMGMKYLTVSKVNILPNIFYRAVKATGGESKLVKIIIKYYCTEYYWIPSFYTQLI